MKRRLAATLGLTASLAGGTAGAAAPLPTLTGQSLGALVKVFLGSMLATFAAGGVLVAVNRALDSSPNSPMLVVHRAPEATATTPHAQPTLADTSVSVAPRPSAAASPVVTAATGGPTGMRRASERAAPSALGSASADLQRELVVLGSARQAEANGDFAEAERLIAELDRRFPHGLLIEERAALRAVTHCEAHTGGAENAREFASRYPASVYAEKVRRVCAGAENQVERAAPEPSTSFTAEPEPGD
ncbi:MAG TPA: hypothetical protein VMI54_01150 [Polyangiaceae bacterium]|nr:hypothetical protein [Polyangiaceae bacterium]